MTTELLIAIVNYHGSDLTANCLQSLVPELNALPGAQVGLCDNGSGDSEVEALKASVEALGIADRTTFLPLTANRGFTGGNNVLIRSALASQNPPDLVFLLNNDTVVSPGALQTLVRFMREHPDVGICGSRLKDPDGSSQRAARRIPTAAGELEAYARCGPISRALSRWTVTPPERHESHACGWISGAALMIRREVLDCIGLLDEDFFTYFEDLDLCLRAGRAAWPIWYVPESQIVHLAGQSSGIGPGNGREKRRGAYWFRARRHYFLKNYGAGYAAAADAAAVAGLLLWSARCLVQGKPNPDPPLFLWDMVRHSVFLTGFGRRPVQPPAADASENRRETRTSLPVAG